MELFGKTGETNCNVSVVSLIQYTKTELGCQLEVFISGELIKSPFVAFIFHAGEWKSQFT